MLLSDDLRKTLAAAAKVHTVCVGDVMLDRYIHGRVSRISPEAPIPVFARGAVEAMLGGAGNVARNVVALGAHCVLLGVTGVDAEAEVLKQLVDAEAEASKQLVDAEPRLTVRFAADAHRPTTLKARFIAHGQQLLRLDAEDPRPVAREAEAALTTALGALSPDVILIPDYAKGVVTQVVLEACHAAARRTGAPIIVDPKGRDFARYGPVDLIKPNARELADFTGLPVNDDADIETALARGLERCAAEALLVTRAEAGMSLLVRGDTVRHFRARAREVFDVSGAGDTVLAALGAALGAGAALEAAVQLAVLASGVVVGKAGTATVTREELLQAELMEHTPPLGGKLADLEGGKARVKAWRAAGLRVGFTNGCFDILHAGHVDYLARARARCDRLIVGVNSDASIRRLKGAGRPVNDLQSRAMVLAAMAAVDLVIPFDADTPLDLIAATEPDALFKGADYDRAGVVGGDLVESWGGEVVLVPLVEGYSTTAAVERLLRAAAEIGG